MTLAGAGLANRKPCISFAARKAQQGPRSPKSGSRSNFRFFTPATCSAIRTRPGLISPDGLKGERDSATALRRAEFCSDASRVLAHCIIDFGKSCEVEINAQQFDQGAHVGLMQVADKRLQSRGIGCLDPARNAFDEGLADRAILVAPKLRSGLAVVHLSPGRACRRPVGRKLKRDLYARLYASCKRSNV